MRVPSLNVERWTLNVGRCDPGFTLVELLVVVTIIVILLALLMPAMSKAMYQADLVNCASRLKALTGTTLIYAQANKRFYPDRRFHPSTAIAELEQPARIGALPDVDDWRPLLIKTYGDINKLLSCPIAGEADYINSKARFIYTSYNIWIGWAWKNEPQRVEKVGDPVTWNGWSSNMLFGDRDLLLPSNQNTQSSHPDIGANKLFHEINQDTPHRYVNNQPATINWWISYTTSNRGPTDDNFSYDDGSVVRLTGISGASTGGQWDERVKNLPVFFPGTNEYNAWINVPLR